MELTIGIIIYDKTGKVLITKPTNGIFWSFPKGLPEPDEDNLSTAFREVLEETSLDLKKIKGYILPDLYTQEYKSKKKKILLYSFQSEENIEKNYEIFCNSYFELQNIKYPENEDSQWIFLENALPLLHEAQKIIVSKIKKSR